MTRLLLCIQIGLWGVSDKGLAMPSARAAAASQPSQFHVSGRAGIAIAAFCVVWFGGQLLRGAL